MILQILQLNFIDGWSDKNINDPYSFQGSCWHQNSTPGPVKEQQWTYELHRMEMAIFLLNWTRMVCSVIST